MQGLVSVLSLVEAPSEAERQQASSLEMEADLASFMPGNVDKRGRGTGGWGKGWSSQKTEGKRASLDRLFPLSPSPFPRHVPLLSRLKSPGMAQIMTFVMMPDGKNSSGFMCRWAMPC